MALKMDEFLLKYYRQLIFNEMPIENRAQFDKYAKNDDFRGNMKSWKSDLMDPVTGDNNQLPDPYDPNVFEQGDWEKLFRAFQNAFRSMEANKKSFKDNKKANDFLNEYFGDPADKLFSLFKASPQVERHAEDLYRLLTDPNYSDDLYIFLQANGRFENREEYNDFVSDLAAKKYNSNTKVRDKLTKVSTYLRNGLDQDYFNKNQNLASAINRINLAGIISGFDDTGVIDQHKLDYFKDNHATLLRTVYKDTKIREVFSAHDNGKISEPLNDAISKVDYANKDSKDFLPEVRDDELNLMQKISKWPGETFEQCLEKYTTLRGDRVFFNNETQLICKAIDGAKIKPTDGLSKVLDESGKIKDKLNYKSHKATEAFDYFTSVMNSIKDTMPNAFKAALYDGHQMLIVVQEMIKDAIKRGKISELKIAMEVLTVVKYGFCTSKIMDAIKKEPMTIFSDKSLSWNKHEGTQFVTTALDKGIKTAFMGIGYGVTIINNKIRMAGGKFRGKAGRLKNDRDNKLAKDQADLNDLTNKRAQNIQNRTNAQQTIQNLNTQGINNQTIQYLDHRFEQTTLLEEQVELLTTIEQLTQWLQNNQNHPRFYEIEDRLNERQAFLQDKLTSKQQEINNLQAWINDPANANNPDMAAKQQELQYATDEYTIFSMTLNQAAQRLQTERQFSNTNKPLVQSFRDSTEQISFMTDQIQKQDDEIASWDDNHKDQYQELMSYWDFLQNNRNMRTFAPRTKKANQKAFDQTKVAQMAAWQSNYRVT